MRHVVVILGNTDGDLLRSALFLVFRVLVIYCLRVHRKPAPGAVLHLVLDEVVRQIFADREVVQHVPFHVAARVNAPDLRHQHRLTVPVEPEGLVQLFRIDIVEQRAHLDVCVGRAVEGQHERYFGRFYTVCHCLRPGLVHGEILFPVRADAVGIVREYRVHAGVRQQLALTAYHPLVVGQIISVYRLVPEIPGAGLPDRVGIIVLRFGILIDGCLGVGRGGAAADVPGPVEHCHCPVFPQRPHVFICERFPPQTVGEYPGIRQHFVGIYKAVFRNDVFLRRRVVLVVTLRVAGLERFFGFLSGEGDRQLEIQLVLHSVFVAEAVSVFVIFPRDAVTAHVSVGLMDQEQILARGLRIVREHELAGAVVLDLFNEFGGNWFRPRGGREIFVPPVNGQSRPTFIQPHGAHLVHESDDLFSHVEPHSKGTGTRVDPVQPGGASAGVVRGGRRPGIYFGSSGRGGDRQRHSQQAQQPEPSSTAARSAPVFFDSCFFFLVHINLCPRSGLISSF